MKLFRYDGHRDSILRGTDNKHKDSSAGTTAEDLMPYFSVSEFKGYEDTLKVILDITRFTILKYSFLHEFRDSIMYTVIYFKNLLMKKKRHSETIHLKMTMMFTQLLHIHHLATPVHLLLITMVT